MNKVKLLSEYGSFLKNNFLEQLAKENHNLLCEEDIHPLKLCKDFSVEDLLEMSVTNLTKLLEAFEEGKITKEIIAEILKLELEALPGVKPEHVEPNDLLTIYTAQKQALIAFIPEFTKDIKVVIELSKELEKTFLFALDNTLQAYIKQRIQGAVNLTESKIREEKA